MVISDCINQILHYCYSVFEVFPQLDLGCFNQLIISCN